MQIYSKLMKNATLLYFLGDFDSVCFIWWGLVGASKLLHRILKFYNYANLCKFIQNQRKMLLLYFTADSDSVVLSDRAWWGLRNFYTELWKLLIMQIYANLFKIYEKYHLSSFQKSQQICTSGGDITHRVIYYSLVYLLVEVGRN